MFKNGSGCIKPKPVCAPSHERGKAAALVFVCSSVGAALPMFVSSLFDEEGCFTSDRQTINDEEDFEKPAQFKRPR